jgi:2-polyprenyl-6-methoxyphenol hydroxylase-like FAD-dependent oxidoreductase
LKQVGAPAADRAVLAEGWPEPIRSFAASTSSMDQSSYCHAIMDRAPLSKWSRENVTLIGDACHSTTPNMGQGACMAIEDAYVLGVLLRTYWDKPDGHTEAFYQYERARRKHTAAVQEGSYKKMKLGQFTSAAVVWFRNTLLSYLPASFLENGLRKENIFDVEPWLVRAQSYYAAEGAI